MKTAYDISIVVLSVFIFYLLNIAEIFAGEIAYVANNDSNYVYVVDLTTYKVIDKINVGGRQYGIAICRDSSFAITTHSSPDGDGITIIDIPDNTIRNKIRLNPNTTPLDIVLTSDCTRAYVSAARLHSVLVVDVFKGQIIDTIAVGLRVEGIDISPDGKYVYAGNRDSNSLSVIATANDSVIKTIGVGALPHDVAVTPDGKFIYVTNGGVTTDSTSWTVSVIETATLTVIKEIDVGDYAFGIAITKDGKFAYLANARSHTVSVIDIEKNILIATIPVWYRPKGIAIGSNGEFVYVATDVGGRVQKIRIADNEVVNARFVAYGLLKIATIYFEDLAVDSDTINFGQVEVPDSAFMNVSVINDSIAQIDVSLIQLSGKKTGSFDVDTSLFSIAVGDSHVVTVRFSPTDTGLFNASLEISSGLRSKIVSLIGFGIKKTVVAIRDEIAATPTEYFITQNFPNPFNPVTVIKYGLPKESDVSLIIYNLRGEEVVRLIDGVQPAGNHKVTWDASSLSSGVYLYRLQAGDFVQTRKMVLLK